MARRLKYQVSDWDKSYSRLFPNTRLDKKRHFGTATRVLLCKDYRPKKTGSRPIMAQMVKCNPGAQKWRIYKKQSGMCLCHGRTKRLEELELWETQPI